MDFRIDTLTCGATFRRTEPWLWAKPLKPRVLAIDPGLRVGWSVAGTEPRRVLAGGFLELDRDHLFLSAWKHIVSLLEEYDPSVVALESYFVAPGAHCGQSIEVRGAIKAAVERAGIKWTQINPARVRAGLGVKGKLKDTQIRELICDLFGMPAKYQPDPAKSREVFFPADVFDAAAVAWAVEL